MSGGTVPLELVLTDQIPNLVIVDRSTIPTRVVLVELTVPWDTSTSFQILCFIYFLCIGIDLVPQKTLIPKV